MGKGLYSLEYGGYLAKLADACCLFASSLMNYLDLQAIMMHSRSGALLIIELSTVEILALRSSLEHLQVNLIFDYLMITGQTF